MSKVRTKPIPVSPEAAPYLATLRRVPDEIMLIVGTREFDMLASNKCVCGWVLRESVARCAQLPDAIDAAIDCWTVPDQCVTRFGGSIFDWTDIYDGVTHASSLPAIEEAFTLRVMEAAGVAKVAKVA